MNAFKWWVNSFKYSWGIIYTTKKRQLGSTNKSGDQSTVKSLSWVTKCSGHLIQEKQEEWQFALPYLYCLLIFILVISFLSVFILVTSPCVEEQKNSHRTRSSILHKTVDRRMQVRLSACFGGRLASSSVVILPKTDGFMLFLHSVQNVYIS